MQLRGLRWCLYLGTSSLLFAPLHFAEAALWKTEAQLTSQYGEPVDIRRGYAIHTQRTFTFQTDNFKIEIEFFKGVSQSVLYEHLENTRRITPEEIELILKENSDGKSWHVKDTQTAEEYEMKTWELGDPAVATASSDRSEGTEYCPDGQQIKETRYWLKIETTAFTDSWTRKIAELDLLPKHLGFKKSFRGTLEFKNEEVDRPEYKSKFQIAIIRDGASVLEIPWSSTYVSEKAHLESGKTYEVVVRDEEIIDLDHPVVFVSDRVHNSHGARVVDSEMYPLVRIKDGSKTVYDEGVCEVHLTQMKRVKAEVGYGLYVPDSSAESHCDRQYPHHSNWIRGGCIVGDIETAFHYVCTDCVTADAKYMRDHANDPKE